MRSFSTSVFLLAAFAVLGFLPQNAASQPPVASADSKDRPEEKRPPHGFRMPVPVLIEALDTNRDGILDAEEIAAAENNLLKLDENKDGKLSKEEGATETLFKFGRGGFGGGPGDPGTDDDDDEGNGGPMKSPKTKILERFDADKDGILNKEERIKARAFLKENKKSDDEGGFDFGGPPGPFGGRGKADDVKPGRHLTPKDVATFPSDVGLYDPLAVRTFFFEFDNKDWEEELEEFHDTDAVVPATLVVDGKTYKNIGLRFHGNTSYMMVPRGQRRSFNVKMDIVDKKQKLLGYSGFNLLNSMSDPSLMRVALYDQLSGQYVASPKANLARVVINGESWGIYVNETHFDKNFGKEWFDDKNGRRWKVPVNFSGSGGLVYHGDAPSKYKNLYAWQGGNVEKNADKAKEKEQALKDLIELCKKLNQTPADKIDVELDRFLDIDGALWFLAVDCAFMDDDGYFSRASDYSIYQDGKNKRFHLVARDSNETFRYGGGGFGGPDNEEDDESEPDGPGQPDDSEQPDDSDQSDEREEGAILDPLDGINNKMRPVIKFLLANPNLKARYLDHLRVVAEESLDWKKIEPMFEGYREAIAEDVLFDTHNQLSFASFFESDMAKPDDDGPFGNPPGIKKFVDERRAFLLTHQELTKPRPTIVAVDRPAAIHPETPTNIVAKVAAKNAADSVILYYAFGRNTPFQSIEMKAVSKQNAEKEGQVSYAGAIPGAPSGSDVYFYVEARAVKSLGTTVFSPQRAALGAYHYKLEGGDIAKQIKKKNKKLEKTVGQK